LVWLIRTAGTVEREPPAEHCCGNTACRAAARSALAAAIDSGQHSRNDGVSRPTVPGQGSNRIPLERNGIKGRGKEKKILLSSRSRPPGKWSITRCRSPR